MPTALFILMVFLDADKEGCASAEYFIIKMAFCFLSKSPFQPNEVHLFVMLYQKYNNGDTSLVF